MRTLTKLSLLSLLALSAACSGGGYDDGAEAADDDLTSASARARKLTFTGYVYVDEGASDYEITAAVRKQTQTAFGALRTAEVGVASRELKDVDASTFKKTKVTVASPTSKTTRTMEKVAYVYKDSAVVPVAMATRTALSTAVMSPDYASQNARILKECTSGDSEAVEFENSIWYVFDPSVSGCHTAIAAEQKTIDADTAKIPTGDVPESEVSRLYYPITVRLASSKTYGGTTYPEYDKLWAGGVKPNRLVISYVNGLIDDKSYPHMSQDSAWGEWIDQLREAMADRSFTLTSIDNGADLTNYTVSGKNVKLPNGFLDIVNGNTPSGVSQSALEAAASDKVLYHWLHFETKVSVRIGSAQPKDVTIELMTYFGSGGDQAPHKYAIKNSDVFVYNGHSYIGYGPLDPSNFSASDFPSSYQMLFIDGCVSYNYYNHGYYDLKAGGTKNLDMIVNGMEAPSWHSGYALGRFTHELIDGSQSSYLNLLKAAVDTDEVGGSLRVVDGEVDNVYKPSKTPIKVK
ncbi:MAG TPA: hypothetical protein VF407_06460 [Polyangiaceae bacterium]